MCKFKGSKKAVWDDLGPVGGPGPLWLHFHHVDQVYKCLHVTGRKRQFATISGRWADLGPFGSIFTSLSRAPNVSILQVENGRLGQFRASGRLPCLLVPFSPYCQGLQMCPFYLSKTPV